MNKYKAAGMIAPYEKTINELKKRLLANLGDKIDSIVLYGSIARNEPREDSDIDLLIVTKFKKELPDKVLDINLDIDLENGTVTSHVYMTPKHLNKLVRLGSPFIESVIKEGIVLYDNGTFERVRRKVLAIS